MELPKEARLPSFPAHHSTQCPAGLGLGKYSLALSPLVPHLDLGNGVPLGSSSPRGLYIFKPYPSAVPLWQPSPLFGIITFGTAAIAPSCESCPPHVLPGLCYGGDRIHAPGP